MGGSEELYAALSWLREVDPDLLVELQARGVELDKTRFVGVGDRGLAQRLNEALARLSIAACDKVVARIKETVREMDAGTSPAADTNAGGGEISSLAEGLAAMDAIPDARTPPRDTEPAPPPTAQWQDQLPSERWLPPTLQALCGEMLEDVCDAPEHVVCEPALPGWRVLAGARRGRLHAHHGTYREDAFAHGGDRERGRFWVFCVCDGAGSSRLSRVGAEITSRGMVRRLSDTLRERFDTWSALGPAELNAALREAVVEAARGNVAFLGEAAAAAGAEPKDFRCTLLLTILLRHGDALLACLSQVGDGFIAGLTADGTATRHAGASASGEFSGEVKCFVPDPGSPEQAAPFGVIPNVANRRALLLCTDGIEDPFFPVDAHVGWLFGQFTGDGPTDGAAGVEWPAASGGPLACEDARTARERLARWLAFEKKGENDDRTVMFIHRAPAAS